MSSKILNQNVHESLKKILNFKALAKSKSNSIIDPRYLKTKTFSKLNPSLISLLNLRVFSFFFVVLHLLRHRSFSSSSTGLILLDHNSSIILKTMRALKPDFKISKSNIPYAQLFIAIFQNLSIVNYCFDCIRESSTEMRLWSLKFISAYLKYYCVFSNRRTKLLIASTNDFERLASGTLANFLNIEVIRFHVGVIGEDPNYPIDSSLQVCRSYKQFSSISSRGHSAALVLDEKHTISTSLKRNKVGIVLGAHFNEKEVFDLCRAIKVELHKEVLLRLHPGKSSINELEKNLFQLSHDDSMEKFSEKVDVIFCSNTNAAIDGLICGIPIVYVADLDPYTYDLHGFVKNGYILDCPPDLKGLNKALIDFYSTERLARIKNEILGSNDLIVKSKKIIHDILVGREC